MNNGYNPATYFVNFEDRKSKQNYQNDKITGEYFFIIFTSTKR